MSGKRILFVGIVVVAIIYICIDTSLAFSHDPGFSIRISRVSNAPRIDGTLADAAWKSASRVDLMWAAADKRVTENLRTQAMAVYDQTALFVAFMNTDPDVSSLLTNVSEHDEGFRGDDSVGIFIEVGDVGQTYIFNIFVNPANTTADMWLPSKELSEKLRNGEIPRELVPVARAYPKSLDWEPKGLKTATHIDRNFWTVEMRIPFDDLLQSAAPEGKVWGVISSDTSRVGRTLGQRGTRQDGLSLTRKHSVI